MEIFSEELRKENALKENIWKIKGGHPLSGDIDIHGAKNAILPLMASSLLFEGSVSFHRVPWIKDVTVMGKILQQLGCQLSYTHETLKINVPSQLSLKRMDVLWEAIRASICLVSGLLVREGSVRFPLPGGCLIGERPIDLHLKGLKALGVSIEESPYEIKASISSSLRGQKVCLEGRHGTSVLATINTMIVATVAKGETCIDGAAQEPEVDDVISFLNHMGMDITREGRRLYIQGQIFKNSPFFITHHHS